MKKRIFICQRCIKYLTLHSSFVNFNYEELNKPKEDIDWKRALQTAPQDFSINYEVPSSPQSTSRIDDSNESTDLSFSSSPPPLPSLKLLKQKSSPVSVTLVDNDIVLTQVPKTMPVENTTQSDNSYLEHSLTLPTIGSHITPSYSGNIPESHSEKRQNGKTPESRKEDHHPLPELVPPSLLPLTVRLLEEAVKRTDIDFPLCMECAGYVNDELIQLIQQADREFASYLWVFEPGLGGDMEDVEVVKREIEELEREKEDLVKATQKLKKEHHSLKETLQFLNASKTKMSTLEHDYWLTYGELSAEREQLNAEHQSLKGQLEYSEELLEKVHKTNVLNDAFHLWYSGHFATINGNRLGRLPSQPVDWNEINVAWGMISMLLNQLAKELNYEFENYSIVSMGCQSKIESLREHTQYELYLDAGSPFHLFSASRYDKAMQGFLDCVGQLIDFVKKRDTEFRTPYEISGDKIGSHSIKLLLNAEEKWTKALKYMITNIKFLVAWISHHKDYQYLGN